METRKMSSRSKFDEEMKNILQDTAEDVSIDYYSRCSDFLARSACILNWTTRKAFLWKYG
jgi:hypothetical protein